LRSTGSELDKTTRAQLARGERMVELLKQEQYQPSPVEHQVIAIFAGTNGYVDDVPTSDVRKFEKELLKFVDVTYENIKKEIKKKKTLDDDLKAKIRAMIEEFKKGFQP
jgi:F-type H+-transporting ATPase subunit alpha